MTDVPGNDGAGTVDHGGDDNKRISALGYNEEERKLRALAGQWKTPPMPAYASAVGYTASTIQTQGRPQQQMMQQQGQQQMMQPQQQAPPPTTTSSNTNTGSSGTMMTTSRLSAPANLPDNSEEYAKALQEAYRKGAEAAARMAQQQQHIPTAASCPDFSSTGSSSQPGQVRSSSATATATANNNGISPVDERTATTTTTTAYRLDHQIHPPPQHQHHHQQQHHHHHQQQQHQQQHHQQQMNNQETTVPVPCAIPDPLSSSMPPPLPPSTASQQIHQHSPHTQITYAPSPSAEQQQPFLQPQQQQQQQQQYPITAQQPQLMAVAPVPQPIAATTTSSAAAVVSGQPVAARPPPPLESASMPKQSQSHSQIQSQIQSQQPGRSLSMPDMSAYAAEAEEEKRLKRLARNRASARLRRLRKKNLVDAYETEVGILEKTLTQLQAHEWGKDTDDHKALLDALGMERGQQAISPEERTTIIQDILKQQMQQVNLLQQAQREQECLAMLASVSVEDENKYGGNDEDDEMFRELQDILQLSNEQKAKLRESSKGLDKEVEALETVSASLEAMQQNDWLLNEGVQNITDQFTSILHKNQQSKLLLWTDANAEAVDQLDHVQVQPLQSAPVFSFGVESTTPGDDE